MSSHTAQQRQGRAGRFPPPVDSQKEFIKRGLDAEDELIEVGVAIVGGGTAGLACANRLLQLLGDDPETMERLGEVPVAVIEKAKTCGGHNLSGAVMRPEPLQELFPDLTREQWREEGFAFGEVTKEAVYLTRRPSCRCRIPRRRRFKNHGNEVVSVSALARYQQQQAEEAGAYILTETAATQLVVEDGRVVGVRSGDKGRGKDGEPLGNFEPGTDIKAAGDGARRGLLGPPDGRRDQRVRPRRGPRAAGLGARCQGGLEGPQAAGPADPHDRALAAEDLLEVRPDRRHLDLPDEERETGEDLVSIGFVVELEYADATTSAHDLLQTFKTHPLVRGILEGGERIAWGAKALPGGGYWSMPKLSMPGALLVGDSGGMVDTMALKGVHHCIKSGMLAAESIYAALKRGELPRRLRAGDRGLVGRKELWEVRNARQPLQKGLLVGGLLSGIQQITRASSARPRQLAPQRRQADVHRQHQGQLPEARRQIHLRQALLGVHHRQRHARRRAQPHPHPEARPARDRRDLAVDVPGRRLRDPRGRAGDDGGWT